MAIDRQTDTKQTQEWDRTNNNQCKYEHMKS